MKFDWKYIYEQQSYIEGFSKTIEQVIRFMNALRVSNSKDQLDGNWTAFECWKIIVKETTNSLTYDISSSSICDISDILAINSGKWIFISDKLSCYTLRKYLDLSTAEDWVLLRKFVCGQLRSVQPWINSCSNCYFLDSELINCI